MSRNRFLAFMIAGCVVQSIVLTVLLFQFGRPIYAGDFIIGPIVIIFVSLFTSGLVGAYRGEGL